MKTTIRFRWTLWLLSINAAGAVLFSGCATPPEHSFNDDFGGSLPAKPMYYVQDKDSTHYTITVKQGSTSSGAERVMNVKEAATDIAKAECHRRGWEKWQLGYIREGNQGWMYVVVAEVTREKYVAPTYPGANTNSPTGNP